MKKITDRLIAQSKYGAKLADIRQRLETIVGQYGHYYMENGPGQRSILPFVKMLIEAIDGGKYPDYAGWEIIAEKSMKQAFFSSMLEVFFDNHPESVLGDLPGWEYEELMSNGEAFGIYLDSLEGDYAEDAYKITFFDQDGKTIEVKEAHAMRAMEAVGFARGYMAGKNEFSKFEIEKS